MKVTMLYKNKSEGFLFLA